MARIEPQGLPMLTRHATPRPLRRIRRALVLLATFTAVLIAAACRLDATGRALAAIGALACLIAWSVLLELEGRTSDRLEARTHRRATLRRTGRTPARTRSAAIRRVA